MELNMFYAFRSVAGNSVWFNPLAIGQVDDDDHYVAFDPLLPYGLVCSEKPKRVEEKLSSEGAGEKVRAYVNRARRPINRQFFTTISERVLALARHRETVMYLRDPELQRRRVTLRQEAQFAAFVERS
jgi:hypothetical protein